MDFFFPRRSGVNRLFCSVPVTSQRSQGIGQYADPASPSL